MKGEVDSASIGSCGYGARVALVKSQRGGYAIQFNKAAKSSCEKVYFESAGKTYYLSKGQNFTPSKKSLNEARSYSGMKISIYSKRQSLLCC